MDNKLDLTFEQMSQLEARKDGNGKTVKDKDGKEETFQNFNYTSIRPQIVGWLEQVHNSMRDDKVKSASLTITVTAP